jgi:hypothetical protein
MRSQCVPTVTIKQDPRRCYKVNYVSARVLATFRGREISLVSMYKATSPVLFEPPFSSSACVSICSCAEALVSKEYLRRAWSG